MSKIRNLHKTVEKILEKYPETRNSDNSLYLVYLKGVDETLLNKPFGVVMMNAKKFNISSQETVGRVRRKIQETRPDLQADITVLNGRRKRATYVKEYAKGEI